VRKKQRDNAAPTAAEKGGKRGFAVMRQQHA